MRSWARVTPGIVCTNKKGTGHRYRRQSAAQWQWVCSSDVVPCTYTAGDRLSGSSYQQSDQNIGTGYNLWKLRTTLSVFGATRASINWVNRSEARMFSTTSLPCSRQMIADVPNRRLLEVRLNMSSTVVLSMANFEFLSAKKERCSHSCSCSISKSLASYWGERKPEALPCSPMSNELVVIPYQNLIS